MRNLLRSLWRVYLNRERPSFPRWMTITMWAAGIYNLAWGALTVLFPLAPFRWAGMAAPNYPQIWQCVGMIVGVYGVAYIIAAYNPFRYWPLIFVGLLGKVLGPIGMAQAIWQGTLPPVAGLTCLTNDLIWWLPFTLILYQAYQSALAQTAAPPPGHGPE